jgi:hypothetical protein
MSGNILSLNRKKNDTMKSILIAAAIVGIAVALLIAQPTGSPAVDDLKAPPL